MHCCFGSWNLFLSAGDCFGHGLILRVNLGIRHGLKIRRFWLAFGLCCKECVAFCLLDFIPMTLKSGVAQCERQSFVAGAVPDEFSGLAASHRVVVNCRTTITKDGRTSVCLDTWAREKECG